ncbi:GAK system CofD-like protein [Marinomonas agarivorans]|nr:GAK system CofD-like protein [Marinomonas agarivorans]
MARIWRSLTIPDQVKIRRSLRMPELGPKILFFSGGSALNKVSRVLKNYTHNSIHFVTPFDSGGSSAKLRDEFVMPAVGDLRSRLMALADESVLGQPDVYKLFNYRLDATKSQPDLQAELVLLKAGEHALIKKVAQPLRELIQTQLSVTCANISDNFELQGASVGNLIIAGGYLNNEQQLDPIVFLFSRLVKVLGEVNTITDSYQHLVAELENGELLLGQHRLTGKETDKIDSPVKRIYLSPSLSSPIKVTPQIGVDRQAAIRSADLICYPPGSFYSSILANLLPAGVAESILVNENPKVYIPNLGIDPEQYGMNILMQVQQLITRVKGSLAEGAAGALDFLLLDEKVVYQTKYLEAIRQLGVCILQADLASVDAIQYDEKKLSEALISLV